MKSEPPTGASAAVLRRKAMQSRGPGGATASEGRARLSDTTDRDIAGQAGAADTAAAASSSSAESRRGASGNPN